MSEPTTEAGKRLVRFAQNMTEAEMLAEVATIEAEAVNAVLDRLVQRIHDDVGSDIEGLARDSEKALHCAWPTITLRILAAIEKERP